MKLADAAALLQEISDEAKGKAPPIKGGQTISTKQASEILGVDPSRVRQMVLAKDLSAVVRPREGDRDVELRIKDVQAKKNNMPKKGRPFDSKSEENKSKAKAKSKKAKAKAKESEDDNEE